MKYTLHINYQFHEDYNSEDDEMYSFSHELLSEVESLFRYIHNNNCDEVTFSLERNGDDK